MCFGTGNYNTKYISMQHRYNRLKVRDGDGKSSKIRLAGRQG